MTKHLYPVSRLRARVLVAILLLRLLQKVLQLLMLLLELRIVLELLFERSIRNAWLSRDCNTSLHSRPLADSLPPLVQIRERVEIHTSKVCDIDPREVGNVSDTVLATYKVLVVLEFSIKNAVETFCLADVALSRVGYPLFSETIEMIGLTCSEG